jgi:hypothetical protein
MADQGQPWRPTGREQADWRDERGQLVAWLTVAPTSDGRFEYAVERIQDGELRHGARATRAGAHAAAVLVARALTGISAAPDSPTAGR